MDALPERGFSLGRAERLRIRSGGVHRSHRRAWRRATCRQTWSSCRRRWRTISCASPRRTRSLARCWRSPSRAIRRFPTLGRDIDHPHRPAALPGLAARRTGRGADRYRPRLARRPGQLRHRLLVLLRGGADRGRHRSPPYRAWLQRADVRTSIPCVPAGVFHGPLVVSMRPLRPADAIRAVQITSRFPSVHGAPVHLGMPEQIGIKRHRQAGLWRRGPGAARTNCRCSGRAALRLRRRSRR